MVMIPQSLRGLRSSTFCLGSVLARDSLFLRAISAGVPMSAVITVTHVNTSSFATTAQKPFLRQHVLFVQPSTTNCNEFRDFRFSSRVMKSSSDRASTTPFYNFLEHKAFLLPMELRCTRIMRGSALG